MQYGTIERELHIDASPEVVFDVVSNPEHVCEWWADEADYPPEPGGDGWLAFGDKRVRFTVADAVPPRLFSFRWTHEDGETATAANSNLVVFELERAGSGTLLRFTETGFRERGWDEARAAEVHADHSSGWDHYLPRLVGRAEAVGSPA
ncbi:MAG TPA: SRPBCC domain-containing protein [Nocardioides sp.]|nr:SRPBCC domain-containing protein [Nocardioides sp.]